MKRLVILFYIAFYIARSIACLFCGFAKLRRPDPYQSVLGRLVSFARQ